MDLQDANLKDVLKIFSVQAGLNFIAAQNVESRKITLYLEKVPIKEAMNQLFKANNLTYEYDEAANIFVVQYWGEPEAEMITRVYKLKHRSVSSSNIEREKDSLFSTKGVGTGEAKEVKTETKEEKDTGLLGSIKQALSKNGKISEDKRTNSIIVTDIPSRFPIIEEIIVSLDVSQPQVMLEVEMLDVNKNVIDRLGFNSLGTIGTAISTPNPFTLVLPGSFLHKGSSIFIGDDTKKGATGSLTLGSTYASLLDFLTQQTDTKFLARPRILTLNNETAEIGVTKDEIVNVKTEIVSQPSGGPTTTTETFERATSLKLTPEGIGIFLRVTPQINMDTGEITMIINPKTSSTIQSEKISGNIALDPEVRATKSIVKIKDGETIVLGGLIHQEKTEVLKKVPILGEIPILGIFFRHKDVQKDFQRELLVFITPHIVKEPDMRLVQGKKSALPYYEPYPSSKTERLDSINSFLNSIEKKKE
jgi:type II secretory pathway component GspD/PulD (secretin)